MRLGVKTLYIEPGSPWENGYSESFNGKLRDEVLNREIFDTLHKAKVLVERWRNEYNHKRPHSALGYRPPAHEAVIPPDSVSRPMDNTTMNISMIYYVFILFNIYNNKYLRALLLYIFFTNFMSQMPQITLFHTIVGKNWQDFIV